MIISWVLLLVGCSFLFSYLCIPLVRVVAIRFGWLDRPDSVRKLHRAPVPRLGGVAVGSACAASIGLFVLMQTAGFLGVERTLPRLWNLMPSILLVFAIGVADDLFGLQPVEKLGGQILAGVLACLGGLTFRIFDSFAWGTWCDWVLTVVWLVACANALNLIDGLDGLAAGLGVIAALTVVVGALLRGDSGLALIAGVLAGSLLGFLRFNFYPASIFLGDSGSLSIGFVLGCFIVMLSADATTFSGIVAPALALFVPLSDTALSFARRLVTGRPILKADRRHLHHRLAERGFTPRQVCFWLFAANFLASCTSLALIVSSNVLRGVAVAIFCAFSAVTVHALDYREFAVFGRLLRRIPSSVGSQLALQHYEKSFQQAASPQECWSVLREAAREFGLTDLNLRLGGCSFEERTAASLSSGWELSVALSASDYVRVKRRVDGPLAPPTDASQVADLLQRSLSEKARVFRPSPVSDRNDELPARVDAYARTWPAGEPRQSAQAGSG